MNQQVKGIVTKGYQVASGQSPSNPYPQGTIKMQLPYFQKLGLDLTCYFLGTLNVSIRPYTFQIQQPTYYFPQVQWYGGIPPEDFSFCAVRLMFQDQSYNGWLYYPHPETKPAHFQDLSTMELILPQLPAITYGATVIVEVNNTEVKIQG